MQCPQCQSIYKLREYSPGHVGLDVYRCVECARSVAKHKSAIPPGYKGSPPINECMADCECGGKFEKNAPQRCPGCGIPIDMQSIKRPDDEITKRDSGEFYVEGYECPVVWKIC
jgi:hypothetical protein